jgi:hypothetical protein
MRKSHGILNCDRGRQHPLSRGQNYMRQANHTRWFMKETHLDTAFASCRDP